MWAVFIRETPQGRVANDIGFLGFQLPTSTGDPPSCESIGNPVAWIAWKGPVGPSQTLRPSHRGWKYKPPNWCRWCNHIYIYMWMFPSATTIPILGWSLFNGFWSVSWWIKTKQMNVSDQNLIFQHYMDVSENWGFSPQIIHFNRGFPLFSPSILGVFPLFLETPIYNSCCWYICKQRWVYNQIKTEVFCCLSPELTHFENHVICMFLSYAGFIHLFVILLSGIYFFLN